MTTIYNAIVCGIVVGGIAGLWARVALLDRHLGDRYKAVVDSLEGALVVCGDALDQVHGDFKDATVRYAALQAELDAERAGGYHALVGHRVTASVTDGGSIAGILSHVYEDAIVLSHPERVAGSGPVPLGGQMTIDRSRVPILQRFEEE